MNTSEMAVASLPLKTRFRSYSHLQSDRTTRRFCYGKQRYLPRLGTRRHTVFPGSDRDLEHRKLPVPDQLPTVRTWQRSAICAKLSTRHKADGQLLFHNSFLLLAYLKPFPYKAHGFEPGGSSAPMPG